MAHYDFVLRMLHVDLYSTEAELVNNSQRSLSDGKYKDGIAKIRLLCLSHGATGILTLARTLREMDEGRKVLTPHEFQKGLHNVGLELDRDEVQDIFNAFDDKGDGVINLDDFIEKLRPPMHNNRLSIIDRVFEKMDQDEDGEITIDDIRRVYSGKNHPKYINGERTQDEIVNEFLKKFEEHGNAVGRVTKEEFINYYAAISAATDEDGYFDLVLRRAYNI